MSTDKSPDGAGQWGHYVIIYRVGPAIFLAVEVNFAKAGSDKAYCFGVHSTWQKDFQQNKKS